MGKTVSNREWYPPESVDTGEIADGAVTSSKIADGEVAAADIADSAITSVKIADGAITSPKLPANEIQAIIDIPILGGAAQDASAASVAAVDFAHTTFTVPAQALKHLKSASLIIDYAWAATADGTIQLYDLTASAVRGETAGLTGGESSEWDSFGVTGLVAGNTLVVRANVTAAGASGEVSTLHRAILRLVIGVS